jgi:pyrroline-5-carboxylate reductase
VKAATGCGAAVSSGCDHHGDCKRLDGGPHADEIDIVLSPRSAARSAELAARDDKVRVAPNNQRVIDGTDIVILAVLPDQMASLCSSLSFRDGQVVAGRRPYAWSSQP